MQKKSGAPCMPYFGTVSSLLQSVDSHGLWGGLTVGLPSALGSGDGGGRKVEVRARSNLITLSALCRHHQCVGVENDSEA